MSRLTPWIILGIALVLVQIGRTDAFNCFIYAPDKTAHDDGKALCDLMKDCSNKDKPNNNLLCHSTVVIGSKQNDDFIIRAFGVAVSPRHFLTTITSGMPKFANDNEELYILNKGDTLEKLRDANLHPHIYINHYNLSEWGDLVLVELDQKSTFTFAKPIDVLVEKDILTFDTVTFYGESNTVKLTAGTGYNLNDQSDCGAAFADDVIKYDPKHMFCGSDTDPGRHAVLVGAPVTAKELLRDNYLLFGLRSLSPLGSTHEKDYLITKVGPHCGWLTKVSNGAVKCVDKTRAG